jgi:hypothetical protein
VLTHVVRSIVDNPDAVQVEGFEDGDSKVLLEVRVGEGSRHRTPRTHRDEHSQRGARSRRT